MARTRMSLGEHIDELRSRLLKSLYGLLIAFALCLCFSGDIAAFLAQPLIMALQQSNLEAKVHVASLQEPFMMYIKVAIYSAAFLASPWVFWQIWAFVSAGLYRRERKYVQTFVPFSVLLFVSGGLFFILVVAPITCNFFIRFADKFPLPDLTRSVFIQLPGSTDTATETAELDQTESPSTEDTLIKPVIMLHSYVSLIITLALAFGLAFQMPLVVFLLGRLSLVKLDTLCSARKYVLFGIVVVAALMTPPDIISQIALGIPMYALYELGIILLRLWPQQRM